MLDGAPFTPVNSSDSDDSLTVLANITGLPDAPHAVTLTAVFQSDNPPNSSMIVFEKAVITPSPTPAKYVKFGFLHLLRALILYWQFLQKNQCKLQPSKY